jgi:hypothetical protein
MSEYLALHMPSDLRNGVSPFKIQESQPRKSRGLASLTVDIPSSYYPEKLDDPRPKARWWTPEFKFYYFFAVFAIPTMLWIPVSLSLSA